MSDHKKEIDPVTGEEIVHAYDDIKELDHRLPNWWLYTLYGTIVFSVFYWFQFHGFRSGETFQQQYAREESAQAAAAAARERRAGPVTSALLEHLSQDDAAVREGRTVYTQNCVTCHGPEGGGLVGPNLTDAFWIHGGTPEQIFQTVRDGFLARAMPAWGAALGPQRTQAVVAYLLTIRNRNVAGGRPPQGDRVE